MEGANRSARADGSQDVDRYSRRSISVRRGRCIGEKDPHLGVLGSPHGAVPPLEWRRAEPRRGTSRGPEDRSDLRCHGFLKKGHAASTPQREQKLLKDGATIDDIVVTAFHPHNEQSSHVSGIQIH